MKRLLVLVFAIVLINNISHSQIIGQFNGNNGESISIFQAKNNNDLFSFTFKTLHKKGIKYFGVDEKTKDKIYSQISITLKNKTEKEFDIETKPLSKKDKRNLINNVKVIIKEGNAQFVLYVEEIEFKSHYFSLEAINKLYGN